MHKPTRNIFSTLLILASVVTTVAAEPAVPTPPTPTTPAHANSQGPRIKFEMPIYDFGRVQAGELVKYSFVFTNVGDESLEVSAVQPSCGCTTAGDWTHKVSPGETGKIAVQFNSSNFSGPVYKTINVTSNDKEKKTTVLQLKGTIWKPIELVPTYSVISVAADASGGSATVKIINHMDEPLELFSPECSQTTINATLVTNQPGKEYQLVIKSVLDLDSGQVPGKVILKTSSTKTPTLEVPFWVSVVPIINIVPPRISLPQAPLKARTPITINIQNNSTNALTLQDPVVNAPGVDVQIKEVQLGHLFNTTITFPEGFEAPLDKPVMLTVKSSQPRMPEIKVPVIQAAHALPSRSAIPAIQGQPPAGAPGKPTASAQVIR
jgi:hypothetical protein